MGKHEFANWRHYSKVSYNPAEKKNVWKDRVGTYLFCN